MDTFTVKTQNGRTIYVSGGNMASLRQFVQQMTRENYGRGATEATYVDDAAADKMLKIKTCYTVSESAQKKQAIAQHQPDMCHYCGMPATGFGFFDEPVCDDCGG